MKRHVLDRHIETVETEYGPVHCKLSTGYGVTRKNMSMMILHVLRGRKAFPLKRCGRYWKMIYNCEIRCLNALHFADSQVESFYFTII